MERKKSLADVKKALEPARTRARNGAYQAPVNTEESLGAMIRRAQNLLESASR